MLRALTGLKSLPAQQKLGSDQMNQVFSEIAVTADARQVGGHHLCRQGRAAMGQEMRAWMAKKQLRATCAATP